MKTKKYDLSLRPVHYACVSGGKDSLFMLGFILSHLDSYPLDCVVHYELEIDWPWVNDVINYMESRCSAFNIPFFRIRPRMSWKNLYDKYDFPTRRVRWCNSLKLDAEKQMIEWVESQCCRPIAYIGFCADEEKRFKYSLGSWKKGSVCYPLAEENITENIILEWAKSQPLFNNWYKYFKRQGCMLCPMLSRKELAYLFKYYPDSYDFYFKCVSDYEKKYNSFFWDKPCNDIKFIIESKWLSILETEEQQVSIFDYLKEKNNAL